MRPANQIGTLNRDEVAQGKAVTQPGPAAPVVVGVQPNRRRKKNQPPPQTLAPASITPTWVPGTPNK